MRQLLLFCVLGMLLSLTGCTNSVENNDQDIPKNDTLRHAIERKREPIETFVLTERMFYRELSGNGKVTAKRVAEVRFESTGRIARVDVKNGDRVAAGETLAELDKFKLEHTLAQAKNDLELSRLELQDVLIGRGYPLEKQNQVPEEEMALAKVKSGYNRALISYELATEELRKATLTAPFAGVVANVKGKSDNLSNTGEVFCLIIDDTYPEVDFSILESELPMVKRGYPVAILPFTAQNIKERLMGEVSEVNPYVENNGMVKVKARVKNNGRLLEGMNVKVTLRQPMEKSLVIPKSAVVMRSGKSVVFTQNCGKAQWNYVEVLAENSDSCIVAHRTKEYEGLSVGDTVIVSGNINLAHDTEL